MGVYSKYKFVNPVLGGTSGLTLPSGTTAERDAGTVVGTMRYNTDLGLVEQYNALGWQSVDAPPTITNFTGTINENTTSTMVITGSNFKTGATCYITGPAVSGTDRSLSTTWISSSSISVSTNATSVSFIGGAAFGLKVLNPSGLSAILDPAGNVDRDPIWQTASGTTTIYDAARATTTVTYSATDADGNTITYSVQSGSLPAGSSLNTTNGQVTTFNAVASDTTSTFTLRATSTSSVGSIVSTQDRSFTIIVKAPIVQTYTAVASTSWAAPFTGNIKVLVVAGGASGGGGTAGGGGAGGLLYSASYPVTNGTSYPITVGGGGAARADNAGSGLSGASSVFGAYTAVGGGAGGGFPGGSSAVGGSGGGAWQYPGGGSAPNSGGTPGQGNSGGTTGINGGGGGGGAGGAGGTGPFGGGGTGLAYDISGTSRFYSGGGGGAGPGTGGAGGSSIGGGGSGNSSTGGASGSGRGSSGYNAVYYGAGGGGGWDYGGGGGGAGFQGIVILRY